MVAKVGPGGTARTVNVPGAVGDVFIVGSYGDRLEVRTALDCGQIGPGIPLRGDSLALFNPVSGAVQVLLGPAVVAHDQAGGTVLGGLLYGERQLNALGQQHAVRCHNCEQGRKMSVVAEVCAQA